MKKVAIITLNYNGKNDTLELLESLRRLQVTGYRLQKIVVDNASSDGSVPAIHKAYPEADIVQAGANLGFAGGYNKGLDYASVWGADYFLLINNDCLIKDVDLITRLLITADSDPKIGLVSPKIYFAPGFEFYKQSLPSGDGKDRYKKEDLGNVIWYGGGKFDWDNIGSIHRGIDEVDQGRYDQTAETGFISGACVLIKKEVLDKVGRFDEKYFLYFEDADFVKRAKDSGFKTYYTGKTAIYHKVSQSTGIGSRLTDYYHSRNRLIFGMKYGRARTKFALLREAAKLFVLGRPAQRKGILDFYLGMVGGQHLGGEARQSSGSHLPGELSDVEYPFKLSIGIVNYNTADLTKKLLESVFREESGFNPSTMEVIVLDNGLIDPCKEKIKEFLPKIKYLQNKENEGFSKGYNKTIKYSLGEYYLMLNSDIEVLNQGLSELIKAEDAKKGEVVLGGQLVFSDGAKQDSVFHLPDIKGAFKEYFLAKWGSYFMYQPDGEKPTRVEGLVMACFLIPKKVLNKAGLLDEGTFIFFEDIEYCRRLKQQNVPVYFVPAAQFIHYHGGSTSKIGEEKAFKHLQKAAEHYHGKLYYSLLNLVLRLGQKLGRVKTPKAKWMES